VEILNLSAEPLGKLHSWLPHDLHAEKIVFLPDPCPGKSPFLPEPLCLHARTTGGVSLSAEAWDAIAEALVSNKGGLGDLGGGIHFLDALDPYSDGSLYFLIHTGSRATSGLVDKFVESPQAFDSEFDRVVKGALANRAMIQETIEGFLGPLELLPNGGVIIRKGAVRVKPGELNVIPSHMVDDVTLVRGTPQVNDSLCSLSYGTGRAMYRSECKPLAESYDFKKMRNKIMIPSRIQDASLRTDGSFAYRDLDDCLAFLTGYVEEVERFSLVAYMGHL
jgi:tRNA-splicing ligase RtcB